MNGKKVVFSKQGDTLSSLAHDYYGNSRGMVEMLLAANPHLSKQAAVLPAGIAIKMPDNSTPKATLLPSHNLWD